MMHSAVISWKFGQILYVVLFIFGSICDFVLCVTLLYLFINRLFKVVLIVDNEWSGNKTKQKMLPILHVITRYFILTVYSIIGVQLIVLTGGAIHGHAVFDRNYRKISQIIFYYFYPFQSLIAVYCCAANFVFSDKLYGLCCNKLHKYCVKQWMMKAK
eukprot:65156_1